tara:strand:- start:306 stop:2138 length:1833 start_codon:yes stop_codon:yes gene_type:complete
MSLVICSNQDADGQSERSQSNVYKPWSFRNTLSSTYKIPANSQVALQSCKVNIDGRVVISSANSKFYQYFGQKLNPNGVTSPQLDETTSYPVYTDFLLNDEQGVLELSVDDFANTIQKAIRETTFHPNVKEQPTCEVLRNASSLDFLGYKFTYNQNTTKIAGIPANGTFEQWYRNDGDYDGTTATFTYNSGVFQRADVDSDIVCAGICPALPMSNLTGEFSVNISGTSGRANASGNEWHVGLSRYINNTDGNGYYYPPYTNYFEDTPLDFDQEMFVDYGIARDLDDDLVLYQWGYNDVFDGLVMEEIDYWDNANSYFSAKESLVGKDYTDVKFEVEGENVKAKIYDNASGAWRTITEYHSGSDKDTYFKPVHQACWCLHPVLAIGGLGGDKTCSLEITDFNDVSLSDYDPKVAYKGGWYETMELTNNLRLCRSVEARPVIQSTTPDTYSIVEVNASYGIVYDNVLILQKSSVYEITTGANARDILGFRGSVIDTPNTITHFNQKTYESNYAPSLVSSLSMFVRLNNFGQNTTNARVGNRSKILSHLTDLESSSGRQTYEPKNLVWLDLDNPAELNVTEFDISFCYVNEQFATILTGQSIVALYFREKPKM